MLLAILALVSAVLIYLAYRRLLVPWLMDRALVRHNELVLSLESGENSMRIAGTKAYGQDTLDLVILCGCGKSFESKLWIDLVKCPGCASKRAMDRILAGSVTK